MAAITSTLWSMMGAVALVLCTLAQASLSFASEFELELSFATPPLPHVSLPKLAPLPHPELPSLLLPKLPSLPHYSLPPLSLPTLPHFSLPPLPSKVTISGIQVPGFSIPQEQPLRGLHLPSVPPQSVHVPALPEINLKPKTFLPPLPSLRFPGFSYPPTPAKSITVPEFNLADVTIPGFTVPKVAVPPKSFAFSRRALPKSQHEETKN